MVKLIKIFYNSFTSSSWMKISMGKGDKKTLFDISTVSIIITINPKFYLPKMSTLAFNVSGFQPCYSSNIKFKSGAASLS